MVGIEKTLEAISDLKAVVDAGALIYEDKELTFGDARYVPAVWSAFGELTSDINAARDGGELKDIDWAEWGKIGAAVIELGGYIATKLTTAA